MTADERATMALLIEENAELREENRKLYNIVIRMWRKYIHSPERNHE